MNNKKSLIFLAIMFFGIFGLAKISLAAAAYYADGILVTDCTTGNYSIANRTCTGSDGKAYNTIQEAVNAATTPGDTVYVRAGTYVVTVTSAASGTDGNNITIRAYGNETVTANRVTVTHSYNTVSGFTFILPGAGDGTKAGVYIARGADHNTISGNTVRGSALYTGSGSYGMTLKGNYNNITGNTMDGGLNYIGTHTGANGSAVLVDSTKSWATNELQGMFVRNWNQRTYNLAITSNSSNTIVAPLVNTTGTPGTWNTGDTYTAGQGLYIVFSLNGINNTIENNVIKNLADTERIFAFGGNCDYTTIRGNEAYILKKSGPYSAHPDIFQRVKPTSGDVNCRYGLVEKNYFHDMTTQIGIFETNTTEEVEGWVIRNNIFANISSRMMMSRSSTYNNTFFQVNTATGGVMDIRAGATVRNNIIIGWNTGTTRNIFGSDPYNAIHDHNYFSLPMDSSYGKRSDTTIQSFLETAYINGGDPKFVAAYNDCVKNVCDFHLKSGSPLIGVGVQLNDLFATDKDGITRGSSWDIGAYQYAGDTPPPPSDTTPPAAPAGLSVN
jgi:hypothetical protein